MLDSASARREWLDGSVSQSQLGEMLSLAARGYITDAARAKLTLE